MDGINANAFYCENKQGKNTHNMKSIGSFLHGKTIESFDDPKNYPPITLPPLQTTVEIEKHRKNTTFDQNYNSLYYRQSSAQNIKINEIANNAFINEINLTSAIIDKIEYHFRDNTFHFIFDVSNNFYFYKYIDILYQRGFLYTDRRLKE